MRVGLGVSLIEPPVCSADHGHMEIEAPAHALPDDGSRQVVRALLLVQVGVIATSTIESLVVGLASPNLVALTVVNGLFATWTALLLRGIRLASPRARKWTLRLQIGWIGLATIDLLLAVLLADRALEPVPIITRMLIPTLVILVLRRPVMTGMLGAAS